MLFILYYFLAAASLCQSSALPDHPLTIVDRAVRSKINQLRHRSYNTLFSSIKLDNRKKAQFDHLWDDLENSIKKFDFAPSVQQLRNADLNQHKHIIRQTQKKWIDHINMALEEWTKYEWTPWIQSAKIDRTRRVLWRESLFSRAFKIQKWLKGYDFQLLAS